MLQDRVGAEVWSQPRFQRGATKAWRENAELVAAELTNIAKSEDINTVLIAGDVQAVHFLKENLPEKPDYIFEEIDGSRQLELDDLEEELSKAIAGFTARSIDALLERFVEERGQKDLACEGSAETLGSLRMAQVDTLLIRSGGIQGQAFCSVSNPSQAALDRKELTELGLDDIVETDATDVLVSGAIASGAKVVVIPELTEAHGPKEGVGAILRY
jgi:hypothetical protein